MIEKILANPANWFPPVDQVDRPYFIAIEEDNRVYSEYTNFDAVSYCTSSQNNWYEKVNLDRLQYFIIKGRFGFYWLDLKAGVIFLTAQHEVGDHPLKHYAISLRISDDDISGPTRDYALRHFKTSEISLMNTLKYERIDGLNTKRVEPVERSMTTEVVFGWELKDSDWGRITFEGIVYNRVPMFDVRLLYTPSKDSQEGINTATFHIWDAHLKEMREKHNIKQLKKGETMEWQERIL